VTFDHPLLKLTGVEGVLRLWREFEIRAEGPEYLFLDEVQFLRDWQTWLKLQVDFQKDRHIVVTGSATPLASEGQESGVGRWHTIRLATLSFYEYPQIKKVSPPPLPEVRSLTRLLDWSPAQFASVGEAARPLVGQFHEYLLRGGFPQCALVPSVELAQQLLREDIVDLADAAIGPSVLLKGKGLLEDDAGLGRAVETAFFKHVFTRYYEVGIGFSYWRGGKHQEVDIVADVGGRLIPFEVKYRQQHTRPEDLKGTIAICGEHNLERGYVITRDMADFSVLPIDAAEGRARLLKVPAPLACYWLGQWRCWAPPGRWRRRTERRTRSSGSTTCTGTRVGNTHHPLWVTAVRKFSKSG